MNKVIKYAGIAFAVLIGLVFISILFSGEAQKSFQQGMDQAKTTVEQMEE